MILIGLLLPFALAAAPELEPKPDAAFFEKFQPVNAPAVSGLALKKGDRLAICGDSITEQKMYSRIMEDYLTMCVPQLKVTVRQYGWSGEKVPGFLARMTNDCLRFKPTVATTCYGMNDCEYRPYEDRIGQTYESNSVKMVEAFKAHGVRVVLGSPGPVSKMPSWVQARQWHGERFEPEPLPLRNLDVAIAGKKRKFVCRCLLADAERQLPRRQEYGTNYAMPGNDGVHPLWAGTR